MKKSSYRVALVHDWLNGMRGGEKVLEYLCNLFPDSEIFTLHCDPESISPFLRQKKIHCSSLQYMPFRKSKYRYYLPLFPLITRTLKIEGFDLVISTSHCAAKNVSVPSGVRHICYCFSPMRYVWELSKDYFGGNVFKHALMFPVFHYLKAWDLAGAGNVSEFIAISETTAQRIKTYYNRHSRIIFPPCDLNFEYQKNKQDYFLVLSALVPYKRVDLAIEAARRKGFHLKIAGKGPEMEPLRKKAPSNVEFLGWVSEEDKRGLLKNARALLFPGLEDFGIVPLEALSLGTPVIAFGKGGVTETVTHNKTGVFFQTQSAEELEAAIEACERLSFNPDDFEAGLKRFSLETFYDSFLQTIETLMRSPFKDK